MKIKEEVLLNDLKKDLTKCFKRLIECFKNFN